ncbi:MAG TPA: hypothetical protein VG722_00945, partial [Tepidisphaeraceae bacterium]|nr:hypothetical protein [Tepidisphaeraceae bacterium]
PGGKPAHLPNLRPQLATRLRIMRPEILFGYSYSPTAILLAIAIWKAILFIPFAGLVFHIGRWLYGLHAGWLALAMLLIDPTFAGHTGLATLDVLAVEAIVLACYVGWRYFESSSRWRLVAAAAATALAVSIKHTALAVPPVLLCYGVIFFIRSKMQGQQTGTKYKIAWRLQFNHLCLAILVFLFCLWASTLFNFSPPRNWMWPMSYPAGGGFHFMRDFLDPLLDYRWPGGTYVGSFLGGLAHTERGHWSFLLGKNRPTGGWWYYFSVVATYKIPLGFFLIFILAVISLIKYRPHFRELIAVIPIGVLCAMLVDAKIDIGFRHFLPALIFIYILAARCVSAFSVQRSAFIAIVAWIGIAGALGHTLGYYPDYIAYINYPRHEPWRDIADSNIDWGQSLKEVRTWIDDHPSRRPIYIACFLNDRPVPYYLDHRAAIWHSGRGYPPSGLLIISPNCVDSIMDWYDSFRALRSQHPIAIIGHNMLVYDMDKMHQNPATRK